MLYDSHYTQLNIIVKCLFKNNLRYNSLFDIVERTHTRIMHTYAGAGTHAGTHALIICENQKINRRLRSGGGFRVFAGGVESGAPELLVVDGQFPFYLSK